MNTPEPAVSVIIPVYGVEPWLAECLDSVTAQTLTDIEVICVDDASPDRSGEILDEYAARDDRFRVFHLPENHGQGFGRNLGLDRARGKYVYLLDSDDMIAPEALERLYALAEADSLDGILFDSEVFYSDEKLARRYTFYQAQRSDSYPDDVRTGEELFSAMIERGEWNCYVQREFWNRAFLDREGVRFPEGSEHEDEVFAFRAVLSARRIRLTHDRFFRYRIRENSVVTSPPAPKNFHGYLICFVEMTRFARERGLSSPAIDINLGRIRNHAIQYYDRMHETCDLAALFGDGPYRENYELFTMDRRADSYYTHQVSGIAETARERGVVCVFGAGLIAERVWRGLTALGVSVDRFLVTKAEGNPRILFGRPVTEAAAAAEQAGADGVPLTVIALGAGYREEAETLLDSLGIEHIYYRTEEAGPKIGGETP